MQNILAFKHRNHNGECKALWRMKTDKPMLHISQGTSYYSNKHIYI
jgi:hypothetical protein